MRARSKQISGRSARFSAACAMSRHTPRSAYFHVENDPVCAVASAHCGAGVFVCWAPWRSFVLARIRSWPTQSSGHTSQRGAPLECPRTRQAGSPERPRGIRSAGLCACSLAFDKPTTLRPTARILRVLCIPRCPQLFTVAKRNYRRLT